MKKGLVEHLLEVLTPPLVVLCVFFMDVWRTKLQATARRIDEDTLVLLL